MPKPITALLDPERLPRKKKKRKKRKVDYTQLLEPPVVPEVQCPHTRRVQDASMCSQCLDVKPSIVHKPTTVDWWVADEDLIPDLEINIDELISSEDDDI